MANSAVEATVTFDGHKVSIEYSEGEGEGEIKPLIEFLFGDLPVEQIATNEATFVIERPTGQDNWQLHRNQSKLFSGKDLNGLGNTLGGEVLFTLIENNQSGMAIHAGLVSTKDSSILLPADSGSGKSSVTTWLLTQGWYYHTDELVIINLQNGALKAFTRPLNIKSHGLAPIGEIFDLNSHHGELRASNMVTMIPHRLVNPSYREEIPPLSAIVFPHYSKDSEPGIQKISGAEAGLELMRSNVIARNLPGHGFSDVTRLVRRLPAYRLHYQHFDDLPSLFKQVNL